jgi:hypothetical protein
VWKSNVSGIQLTSATKLNTKVKKSTTEVGKLKEQNTKLVTDTAKVHPHGKHQVLSTNIAAEYSSHFCHPPSHRS